MCGEKAWVGESKNNNTGSPPHVRGKVDEEVGNKLWFGITPACAGKSRYLMQKSDARRDHPRMCGEKPKKIP